MSQRAYLEQELDGLLVEEAREHRLGGVVLDLPEGLDDPDDRAFLVPGSQSRALLGQVRVLQHLDVLLAQEGPQKGDLHPVVGVLLQVFEQQPLVLLDELGFLPLDLLQPADLLLFRALDFLR